jgi:hypothetical protein
MTITLPPDIEERLKGEASRRGLPTDEYVRNLIVDHLPPPPPSGSLIKLLDRWDAEDATDDPEEIAKRTLEAKELEEGLNRNRLEMEGPLSRKLF